MQIWALQLFRWRKKKNIDAQISPDWIRKIWYKHLLLYEQQVVLKYFRKFCLVNLKLCEHMLIICLCSNYFVILFKYRVYACVCGCNCECVCVLRLKVLSAYAGAVRSIMSTSPEKYILCCKYNPTVSFTMHCTSTYNINLC